MMFTHLMLDLLSSRASLNRGQFHSLNLSSRDLLPVLEACNLCFSIIYHSNIFPSFGNIACIQLLIKHLVEAFLIIPFGCNSFMYLVVLVA